VLLVVPQVCLTRPWDVVGELSFRESPFYRPAILLVYEAFADAVVAEDDDLLWTKVHHRSSLDFSRKGVAVGPYLECRSRYLVLRSPFFYGDDVFSHVAVPPLVEFLGEVVGV